MSADDLPLYRRFPELREIPRVSLCRLPSPVQLVRPGLWVKRDDLDSELCGGNKVRALEFLLGGVKRGATVLTTGGAGSTHVLTTMVHGARVGARVLAERWRHDMNPSAERVDAVITARGAPAARLAMPIAYVRALATRFTRRVHYVPIGGSTPLGILGHVNAALELVDQIQAGELPRPANVIVPLGSGGTAAGLALGFAIAEVPITVVAARVAPRLAANRRTVRSLIRRTSSLIERYTGARLPCVWRDGIRVTHDVYGGAYGRPLERARPLTSWLARETGIALDGTYSAKAFVTADAMADEQRPALFWLTFDARCIHPEAR